MLMRTKQIRPLLIAVVLLLLGAMPSVAQSAFSIIERDRSFTAGNYGVYPDKYLPTQTPAPKGYQPFYISHYGRHGSRYLNDMKGYKEPYKTLQQADSLGKLTEVGKMALREMKAYIDDAEGRWGDLTDLGTAQQCAIAHRMLQNYPMVFRNGAFVDARSTIVTRCVLSMGAFVLQLIKERPKLQVSMSNSYSDMWYMNHQSKALRDSASNAHAQKAINRFIAKRWRDHRLGSLFFNDSAYVRQHVDLLWTIYYLIKASLIQQNSQEGLGLNPLLSVFTNEELYVFWQLENAWSYLHSGFYTRNGGMQPYTQLNLLEKMISEADSIVATKQHGASLRFGHETVLLPLVCLMGVNGYDLQTGNLDELEPKGWWASQVYPMAGNLQIVFYRKNAADKDPLIKVLLNEKEATLPLSSDLAPYYRWSDVRSLFLKRIAEGESALGSKR